MYKEIREEKFQSGEEPSELECGEFSAVSVCPLRDDRAEPSLCRDELMQNSGWVYEHYFIIPGGQEQ